MRFYKTHSLKVITKIFLVFTSIVHNTALWASEPVNTNTEQALFEAATLINRGYPTYPESESETYNSASVLISFMVDKNGHTFEPVVINSTRKEFEKAALSALENYQFIAATYNDQVVESIQSVRILFLVNKENQEVNQQFDTVYRDAINELKKDQPNKERLITQISLMENSTHMSPYNYSNLNIIKQNYAQIFDSKQSQIDAIEELLLFESRTNQEAALDNRLKSTMRRKLVLLYIQTQQYGSAVQEFEELRKIDSEAGILFEDALKQMEDIYQSNQIIQTPITLSEEGYTTINLFKSNFGFHKTSNDLNRVKLRCDKKFASLGYQKDLEYKIPKSWGRCNLQVIGTPNSKSVLYQF